MLSIPEQAYIYICNVPVDLRKGLEGLGSVSNSLVKEIPLESYFIFLNRKRNRIKILSLTAYNLSYWFMRSRRGVFAPKEFISSCITRKELEMILYGDFPYRLRV